MGRTLNEEKTRSMFGSICIHLHDTLLQFDTNAREGCVSVGKPVWVFRVHFIFFTLPRGNSPYWTRVPTISSLHDHTQKHHTQLVSSGRVIGPMKWSQLRKTQHSQQANIHAPAGFELTVHAIVRPQTHILDRTATGIGRVLLTCKKMRVKGKFRFWCVVDRAS